ncbi:disease resistance protein RGA5-like [Triticum dicoccoides]|uniref:disease resistance protein RGA5-like n=1 Tax=Triticum dicoccoides TaxID=85692 RepID=UPI000E7C22E1|nr:disease resistance protein RGA5-like [Triticum dicoccoides]
MEGPISVSQGAMRSLPGKLEWLLSEPNDRLRKGVKNKIRTLKGDLEELIDKYLLEPSEVEAPALTASSWMKQVRELSYDINDFVDGLDRPKIQKESSPKISRFRKKRKRRQEITDEISRFRTRVKEAIQLHKDHLGNLKMWPSSSGAALDERLLSPIHGEAAALPLVGVGSSIEELSGWLANDGKPERKVASIVGVGGVGKTTLAKELYYKLGGQFQCHAFVRTTQKSDQRGLLISILSQVRPHQSLGAWGVHTLVEQIKGYLKDKTYFIIIDDIWTPSTWDIVNRALPKGDHCTRILTTTEVEVVARICCADNSKYIFKKNPLSEDESKELFSNRVSAHQSAEQCPKGISEIPEEFIRETGGLPLAIIMMASLLACQPASIQQWNYTKNLSSPSLVRNANMGGIIEQVLNLSYNSLPPYLKTCMLYLSLYEEDNIIWKDDLVKQWISEDFICAMEGKDKEGVAHSYFDELIHRGMIQPVDISSNDEVLSCTVHYMVLHLITYKSIEENFITTIDQFQTTLRLADKVRRLALHFGHAEDATPPTSMRLSQVRSLAFSGLFKCMPPIVEFRFLRVLILKLWVAPEEMRRCNLTGISELFGLRYLQIDACHVSVELPAQMQWLRDLVALEIEAKVSAIPPDIVDIPGMLYLSVPSDAHLPTGIGRMTSLRTLGHFDLSNNLEESVMDLGELTNLQNLRLTCSTAHPTDNLKKNMECLGLILEKLSSLKSVTLAPASSSLVNTLYVVSASSMMVSLPPALLQRLELSRRCCVLSSLPEWIGKLSKLSILKIAVGILSISDIDILKGLPVLNALSLHVQTPPAGRIAFDNKGFLALKYFKFMCAAPCLAFLEGALPSVQKLKLGFNANRVDQHSLVAAGFEYLKDLKMITAKIGCSGADASATRAAESVFLSAINKHPSTLIVIVQCVDWVLDDEEDKINLIQGNEHFAIHAEGVSGVNSRKTQRICDEDDRGKATEEQEHATLEKHEEIQEVMSDLNTGKTFYYGEVSSTEQDHLALEKQQEIQEERVSAGVNTGQETWISHGEASKGASMEEQVDIIMEEQHEYMKKSPEQSNEHVNKVSWRVTRINHVSVDLATAAMCPLFRKLAELFDGKYKLQNSVKRDLKCIQAELRSIHANLDWVAESPFAQLWVNDFRKLSYNLEDAVDNFLVQVDSSEPSISSNSLSRWTNKMSSLHRKVQTRHQIAHQIKGIKYQIQDLSSRHRRAFDEFVANPSARTVDPRLSALDNDEKETVGIQLARDEIIKRLIDGNDDLSKQSIKTVSIVGFAGIGKTTLAKAVYDSLQSDFVYRAFVSVRQNPEANQIFMDILFQLDMQKYLEAFNLDTMQLIDKLRQVLKNKRYIIVIDDIWNTEYWHIIKSAFIDCNCGSRMIITTRNFKVAAEIGEVYNLKPLSRESSEELLHKRLFGRKGNCPYDQPTELFEKVLQKCCGVPLAIITIANLLASKPMDDWTKVYNCTGFGDEDNEYVENLRRVVLYSYYDLPSRLRICLLHLGIYPRDYQIKKETLIWKWIAEGIVQETQTIDGLYKVGERYFDELLNSSMIQPVEKRNGIVYTCRVNFMVLDMIRLLTEDEIMVVVLEGGNEQHTSGHKDARRLAIQNSVWKRNSPLSDMCTPQMRSFNAIRCHFGLMPPLSKFCALRVLCMEDCTFTAGSSYHLRHLGNLHQLRYLGLCNSPIDELPKEIGDLKFLQTLDVRYTLIKELRPSVCLLRQLRCLRVDGVSIRAPEWIGKLTSLEELSLEKIIPHPLEN